MSSIIDAVKAVSLEGQGKIAVVVGGTTGIGAGVARVLASKKCGRVIVVGRSEQKAKGVLVRMRDLSDGACQPEFVRGDLSTLAGMRDAVDGIRAAAGGKIDYLFLSQNGMPNRNGVRFNEDGNDAAFTVQVISRFFVAHRLITTGSFKDGARVVSLCSTGRNMPDLDVEDLSLRNRKPYPSWWNQSQRNTTVLDSLFLEMIARYPQYHFFSIYPGLVATENFQYDAFPILMSWILWLAMWFAYTPEQYALYPLYLMLVPEATDVHPGYFFHDKLSPVRPGSWAQKEENRQALWTKITQMFEREGTSA